MQSKNKPAPTAAERRHILAIKALPCSVCNASGPSDAHHIDQSTHYLTIPLCRDCHMGSHNGIHGQKRLWNVMKKTELSCLGDLIKRLSDGMV